MNQRTKKCLEKIIEHSKKIVSYTEGYCFDNFIKDTKTLEAVVFNLSQIGELAGFIDEKTKTEFSNVDWQGIKGLRNRIVHDYENIKPKIIWSIITDEIEALIVNIQDILKGL